MDKDEAREVLQGHLTPLRDLSYEELKARFLNKQEAFDTHGPSGAWYQLEIQGFWDDRRGGNLRILGSIDDGGWRAFSPLTDSFIMAPDGSFIGEDPRE